MMKYEDICDAVKAKCPEMLSHENFIASLSCMFEDSDIACKKLMWQFTDEEYEAYVKVREVLCTATVGQLIKHLQDNFKPTDKVCYMDCVQGCKNDCTYMTKDQLGDRFFKYVKTLDCEWPYVDGNDVIVG